MRLLPRRALVALGLALSFVVSAAAPAYASVNVIDSTGTGTATSGGSATIYYDGAVGIGGRIYEDGAVEKVLNGSASEHICVETWIDLRTINHRPPDVIVNCRHGVRGLPYSASNYMTSTGAVGASIWHNDLNSGIHSEVDVEVCAVDVAAGSRRINQGHAGANCVGTGVDAEGAYDHMSWETIQALPNIDRPQYVSYGAVNVLPQGETMNGGDVLYSPNGVYRFVMQADGNLVKYDPYGVLWQSHTSGNPGAHLEFQASDGNLVLYSPGHVALWSSGVYHTGAVYSFSMDNDGYARVRDSGGCLGCAFEVWAA